MARAYVELTCSTCGQTFKHIQYKHNSAEARSYEEWAKTNITTCPDCYRQAKADAKAAEVSDWLAKNGIVLPELHGKSEKQIRYAERMRSQWLGESYNRSYATEWKKRLDAAKTAEFADYCKAHDTDAQALLDATRKSKDGFLKADAVLTEVYAGKLLDVLNGNNR